MEVSNTPKRINPDLDLIALAKGGDQGAFSKLMGKYREAVYRTILKLINNRDDAEDVLLVSFSKAFHNIQNYSPEFAFSTWIFKIASNNAIDFLRKKRLDTTSIDRQTTVNGEEKTTSIIVEDTTATPEAAIIKDERALRIRNAVESLSPKYKQLIELRYFEELSYEEIATRLDIPLGTVKAQIFRAKETLFNNMKSTKDRY